MGTIKSIAAGLFLGLAAVSVSGVTAQATLLSIDDSTGDFGTTGSGVVTFDDVNKLEWLDLTESTNRSFNTVAGEFGPPGDFTGWRHATRTELNGLFTEGGFTPDHNDVSPTLQANAAVMEALVRQLGITTDIGTLGTIPYNFRNTAFFAGTGGVGEIFLAGQQGSANFGLLHAQTARGQGAFDPDTFVGVSVAHWLVRELPTASIPEPGTLAILGLGLVGLGFSRRRKAA